MAKAVMLTLALFVSSCNQAPSSSSDQTQTTPNAPSQPANTSTTTTTPTTAPSESTDTSSAPTDDVASNQPAPLSPDTFVIDSNSQPETLDPAWSFYTADSQVLEQVYEHLVDFAGGSVSEFVPELAVEVPTVENGGISADLLTYTFTLRDGITFWDGTPLSCTDAEYSFERFLAMDRSGGGSFLLLDVLVGVLTTRDEEGKLTLQGEWIASAVECQDNRIIFHLDHPFPPFLQLMAHTSAGSIYSKAFAIANGAVDNADPQSFLEATNNPTDASQTALFNKAMGSGPFRLEAWDQAGQQVILSRYEAYRHGPASLKSVIYATVPEFNTRLLRLSRGDADVSYLSDRSQTQQLKDAAPAGVRLIEKLPGFTTETIHFMQDIQQADVGNQFVGSGQCDGNGIPGDFFQDVHTRRAFAHAFSQEAFIRDFLQGAGVVAATPIPPQIEFVDPSVLPIPFDLEAAEAEFKLAQCDGMPVWETGFKFIAVYNEGNARRQAALEQLEFHVESLNANRPGLAPFDITVISQPGAVLLNNVFQQQMLPMFVFGWSPDFIDIDNWIRQWMDAEGGAYASSTLFKGERTAHWIALLNEAIRTVGQARRQEIYSQLQRDYVDVALAITLPNRTLDNAERAWVHGNYYNPADGDPQSPPELYALSKRAGGKVNLEELRQYGPEITEF